MRVIPDYRNKGIGSEGYQFIEFDTKESGRNLYTTFNVLGYGILIPDYLVRVFEEDGGCKPFTVMVAWKPK
jgi:hypothetical protein